DTNSLLNDGSSVLFDKATRIYLIGALDVPTIKGLNDLKEILELLGVITPKIRMVINKIPEKPDISIKEIANLIPFPLLAKIKENPEVRISVNKGEIYSIKNPETEFTREIARLASGIIRVEDMVVKERKRGLFG
ncbi:MAG: hypothetical protein ACPLSA_00970, partial [Caldanaerobacter sp.]